MDSIPGKEFERAVHDFAISLTPNAKVIFDHKVLDHDSGSLRQVDVWIEGELMGHWPLRILVSCKDHCRRVDIGKIDAFITEVRSTGATTGIIYSSKGFSATALRKASRHGLTCCRMYKDAPPETPDVVRFPQIVSRPQLLLQVDSILESKVSTWGDLLNTPLHSGLKVFQALDQEFMEIQSIASENQFRELTRVHQIDSSNGIFKLVLGVRWRHYCAFVEAFRCDGSFSYSNSSFLGTQSGPWMDLKSVHPGEGWEEVNEIPKTPIIHIVNTSPFPFSEVKTDVCISTCIQLKT